jgi:long-chain acyl-CoA synthetase
MTFAKPYSVEHPEEIAICDPEKELKWAEVDDILNRCANGLQSLDLGPDVRIAVFAENAVETAMANLGGLVAGASVVPVNFHLTAEEVNYILSDSGARVLFVGPETWERGVEAAKGTEVHTVVAWGAPEGVAVSPWSEWLASNNAGEPDQSVPPLPNLLYTSGTTGRPKGTDLPPTMFAGGATVDEHLANFKASVLERTGGVIGPQLVVGPMYHTGPLSGTRQLIAGVSSVIMA